MVGYGTEVSTNVNQVFFCPRLPPEDQHGILGATLPQNVSERPTCGTCNLFCPRIPLMKAIRETSMHVLEHEQEFKGSILLKVIQGQLKVKVTVSWGKAKLISVQLQYVNGAFTRKEIASVKSVYVVLAKTEAKTESKSP